MPEGGSNLRAMLFELARRDERRECEGSLLAFLSRAWREFDPSPFVYNWHHEAICDQLEALARGEIRDLVVNIPPRPVHGDALVLTRNRGSIPLRDVRVGDCVLTHRRRWRLVEAVHPQGAVPCLEITTNVGRVTAAAADHRFLTPNGWKDLGELRRGSVVGIVAGLRPEPVCSDLSPEGARLLGYLVGDGSCIYATPRLTAQSDSVANDAAACAEFLGFRARHVTYGSKTRQVVLLCAEEHKPDTRAGARGPVRKWMETHDLFGKTSYTKRVPAAVMSASDGLVAEFLGAYWSCDGYIEGRGKRTDRTERSDVRIGCASVSLGLMRDIQYLLSRLGISAILRVKTANIKTARQGDKYVSYTLDIARQTDAARFASLVPIKHEKSWRLSRFDGLRDFDRDIWGEEVETIVPVGEKECFCLTVAEDHSFVADGFAVHNCGKTNLISIAFPAWLWIQPPERQAPLMGPHVRLLCVSYGATLAEVAAVKMRRLVQGPWYQSHWGKRVTIRGDQAGRGDFGNTAGGERISNSIEGGILGRGGDIQIIDDPHKVEGAESDIERERTLRAMSEGLTTRITDPRIAARVLVMQRLHTDDATHYALDRWPDPVHVMLPMRYDAGRPCDLDPRENEGELLWPEVWGEDSVAREERELGSYGASGQLQQMPIPRGGGIISEQWWQLWGARDYPPFGTCVAALDTAYKQKEESDYNALTVWAAFAHPETDKPKVMLREAWQVRTNLADLVARVIKTCREHKVDTLLIEDAARGSDVADEIHRLVSRREINIELVPPLGDKVSRLHTTVPLFENEIIYAPDTEWAQEVIDQVAKFPRVRHDDLVDTVSLALGYLRKTGVAVRREEHDENILELRRYRKPEPALYDV